MTANYQTLARMTKGYVFRVENPATVSYQRHIGRTGKLVTAEVTLKPTRNCNPFPNRFCNLDLSPRNNPFFVSGIRATLFVPHVPDLYYHRLCAPRRY